MPIENNPECEIGLCYKKHFSIELICLLLSFFFFESDIRIPRYLKLPFTEELMSNTLIFAWTLTE